MKVEMSLDEARSRASRLRRAVIEVVDGARIEFAGSLRRQEKEIGDFDLLVETPKLAVLRAARGVSGFIGGNERATLVWEGVQVDVWRVRPGTWGAMLFYVTGPKGYFIAYALRAQARGMKLTPRGLMRGETVVASETEEEIYTALSKYWKSPVLRGK